MSLASCGVAAMATKHALTCPPLCVLVPRLTADADRQKLKEEFEVLRRRRHEIAPGFEEYVPLHLRRCVPACVGCMRHALPTCNAESETVAHDHSARSPSRLAAQSPAPILSIRRWHHKRRRRPPRPLHHHLQPKSHRRRRRARGGRTRRIISMCRSLPIPTTPQRWRRSKWWRRSTLRTAPPPPCTITIHTAAHPSQCHQSQCRRRRRPPATRICTRRATCSTRRHLHLSRLRPTRMVHRSSWRPRPTRRTTRHRH